MVAACHNNRSIWVLDMLNILDYLQQQRIIKIKWLVCSAKWIATGKYIPGNNFFYGIGVTLLSWECQDFSLASDIISQDVWRLPKTFQRVLSNANLGTQRNTTSSPVTFLLKWENSEKIGHSHRLFFSLIGSSFFK